MSGVWRMAHGCGCVGHRCLVYHTVLIVKSEGEGGGFGPSVVYFFELALQYTVPQMAQFGQILYKIKSYRHSHRRSLEGSSWCHLPIQKSIVVKIGETNLLPHHKLRYCTVQAEAEHRYSNVVAKAGAYLCIIQRRAY
jgi:hypothetical protein